MESEILDEDPWMRFDDLARERVTEVDIHEALKKESPYLLFYQVQPIGEDGDSDHEHQLPSYTEATSRSQSDSAPLEKPYLNEPLESDYALNQTTSDPAARPTRPSTEINDFAPPSSRTSLDVSSALDLQRGRTGASTSDRSDLRRKSVTLDTSSFSGSATDNGSIKTDPTSNSVPSTPSEEKSSGGGGFLNVAKLTGSRRGSKPSPSNSSSGVETKKAAPRSRPTSTEGGKRLSLNMTKLAQRMSKGQSTTQLPASETVPEIVPSDAVATELAGQKPAAAVGGEGASALEGRVPASQPPQVAPASKKERKKMKAQAQGGKEGEERECVVM